jgi:hypothetical protein
MRILRVVGSRDLSCGCCVGLYELFSGTTVQVVDWHADGCHSALHWVGAVVFGPADGTERVSERPGLSEHLSSPGSAARDPEGRYNHPA